MADGTTKNLVFQSCLEDNSGILLMATKFAAAFWK